MQTDPIITALTDQLTCYQRLAKLTQIQHDHVQNSQTDKLLEVLSQRQQVLDQVVHLEQIISPAKRKWSDYLMTLDAKHRGTAEGLMAETKRLLEQITTTDRNDAIVLQQRKVSLGTQINKAASARTVNRNYAAAAYRPKSSRVDIQQ